MARKLRDPRTLNEECGPSKSGLDMKIGCALGATTSNGAA